MKLNNQFTVPVGVQRAWEVLLDLERVAPCLPGAQLSGGDGTEFQGQMTIKLGPVTSRYQGTVNIEQADADTRRAVMRARARDVGGAGTAAATISTEMRAVAEGTHVAVETDIQISGPAAQFGRGVMQDVSSKLIGRFADCLAEEMAADGAAPQAVGINAATPAVAATGPDAASGATAVSADWAAAAVARAPTQPGGYEDTPVGRLPTGPAADAALAAAAGRLPAGPAADEARTAGVGRPAPGAGMRRADEVLDLGEIARGALLKRAVPAAAALATAATALLVWRTRRRR
jgi:carbon monoxide dehydrogenase subunit G